MNHIPVLSIIIPISGPPEPLHRCIRSLKLQPMDNFEVICVYTETRKDILNPIEKLINNDSKFQVVSFPGTNANVARNIGLKYARGKYVHFLDLNNWHESDNYEKICKYLTDSDVDLCLLKKGNVSTAENLTTNEEHPGPNNMIQSFRESPFFFINDIFTLHNKIYKKNLIVENNILFDESRHINDSTFYLDFILKADNI